MSDSKLNFAAKVLPLGYQIVSEEAINWLFENHPEAYQGFYERVSGLTQRALDVAYCDCETKTTYINRICQTCGKPHALRQ